MLMRNMFGVYWVLSSSTYDILLRWWIKGGNKKAKEIWNIVPHAILWCIWREKNSRNFDGIEKSIIDLKSSLVKIPFLW